MSETEDFGTRKQHVIHIGGVCASPVPAVVRTVLGSCISVCLRDPVSKIGGMNHFMLPQCLDGDFGSSRYGVNAMELLINQCMKFGADRRRFIAKVFGGGHVLKMRETDGNVPQSNIKFALEFLEMEKIPIAARDVGGYSAREVYFFTDTGRILLKRLQKTGGVPSEAIKQVEAEERRSMAPTPATDTGSVTLF